MHLVKIRPQCYFQGFGEGSFIFRDLGRKHNFFGFLGGRGLRKNILGSWGERSFFFQGAGSKDPPVGGGGGAQ